MAALTNLALLLFSLLLFTSSANAAPSGALAYLPEQQVLQQLPALEQQSAAQQKLLLIVLGADWCHDSVALIKQFSQPEFATQLQQRFNTVMIDVGYLQYGSSVTKRYNQPAYYGTPTVMIINPATGQLLNKADLMLWTDASTMAADDYQQYFIATNFKQQFNEQAQQLAAIAPALQQQITRFEQQQAEQLTVAYQHAGSLLKAYKTSKAPASDEFKQVWDEVKAFRTGILPAVLTLQQQAITLPANTELVLPVSSVFSF